MHSMQSKRAHHAKNSKLSLNVAASVEFSVSFKVLSFLSNQKTIMKFIGVTSLFCVLRIILQGKKPKET